MVPRNLEGPLREAAAKMPVVAVTGPRQSGKTTLCRGTFPEKPYVSLEPLDARDYAASDPRGFLGEYRDGAILDEIQRAPELFGYLQEEVDERPEPGRFVVTGSQHFGLTQAVTQTLAGRIALFHLLPLSLDEIASFGEPPGDLWTVLWRGGYPRLFDRGLDPARWLADYATTYVQRDVRQVLEVTDLTTFTAFVRLVAGSTANELNLSRLGGDAGVTHPTVRSWLSVLEASFVCHLLPPWARSARKQLVKSPKIHFIDSGLACHLLGITAPQQLRHHPLRGAVFESWVVSEVMKSRLHRGLPARLFHYRESRGPEIDLVCEQGELLTAVEAKSGATVASDFFTPLERFRREAESRLPHLVYDPRIVYGGDRGQSRRGATVIPWDEVQKHSW